MENKFSEKISTQLSAALLATPEELASSKNFQAAIMHLLTVGK